MSTAGYSKQGLPGDRTPANSQVNFINEELGLKFHSESAMLRGILEKVSVGNRAFVNGAVIPARSQNDTANNPHNPMCHQAGGSQGQRGGPDRFPQQ